MHPTRARSVPVVVTLLMVLALCVGALGSPAGAAPHRKPVHHAKYDVKRLDATDYLFFGTVSTYPRGKLLVLRKVDGTQRFTTWKKVRIQESGKFSTRLSGGNGDCFRMRIPGTDDYRTTIEDLGCIVPQ